MAGCRCSLSQVGKAPLKPVVRLPRLLRRLSVGWFRWLWLRGLHVEKGGNQGTPVSSKYDCCSRKGTRLKRKSNDQCLQLPIIHIIIKFYTFRQNYLPFLLKEILVPRRKVCKLILRFRLWCDRIGQLVFAPKYQSFLLIVALIKNILFKILLINNISFIKKILI